VFVAVLGGDADVELRASNGRTIARARTQRGFLVLEPDRPLCLVGDDSVSIVVSGAASHALEIWRLEQR
jgi:hypothetical protein